jgi:hypothetical protein
LTWGTKLFIQHCNDNVLKANAYGRDVHGFKVSVYDFDIHRGWHFAMLLMLIRGFDPSRFIARIKKDLHSHQTYLGPPRAGYVGKSTDRVCWDASWHRERLAKLHPENGYRLARALALSHSLAREFRKQFVGGSVCLILSQRARSSAGSFLSSLSKHPASHSPLKLPIPPAAPCGSRPAPALE